MRLKVISCEVLFREIAMLAARSANQVDLEFLPKGLHDMRSVRMRDRLQQTLDAVDASKYDAVAFGYALCGNGLVGLTARSLPIVVPRGHDCITFFLGSRERYSDYFVNHPGVYFKTTGWIERGNSGTQQLFGDSLEFDTLVEKYGEDNARYLMEELHAYKKTYRQFTYISMGVAPDEPFERATRDEADARGWQFEKLEGDISLLEKLVNGDWDDNFLVVPPGWHIAATHDDSIITACAPPEMPKILIRLEPLGQTIEADSGTPLREILFDYSVEFPCGGESRCKRCRVRVVSGELSDTASAAILSPLDFAGGWRLACRAAATGNLTLEVGQWESNILSDESSFEFIPRPGLGIAIDLGTTTLVAQLVDLETASVLGVRTALNPQARYGADVMTRVQCALTREGREELSWLIRSELGRMISELMVDRPTPSIVTIAGNTVMHHLFCGFDVEPLAHAPFEPLQLDEEEFSARALNWPRASGATIRFLPNLGGFVGSDILAGIIATQMDKAEQLTALVDLGTNGEIVLGNRDRMICTSTAVGPAFEGGRISCGMRASTGAISSVELDGSAVRCHVLGNGKARGICGSGLVDAVACGLDSGAIFETGRMPKPIELVDGLSLTQQDVRQVQLAKGAIAGGLRVLLQRYGATSPDVKTLYLAGAFGNYINVASARRIGLLQFDDQVIQPAGNTALLGAKRALFEDGFNDLRRRIQHVPLGADPEFQDAYVDCMAFPAR